MKQKLTDWKKKGTVLFTDFNLPLTVIGRKSRLWKSWKTKPRQGISLCPVRQAPKMELDVWGSCVRKHLWEKRGNSWMGQELSEHNAGLHAAKERRKEGGSDRYTSHCSVIWESFGQANEPPQANVTIRGGSCVTGLSLHSCLSCSVTGWERTVILVWVRARRWAQGAHQSCSSQEDRRRN